MTIFSESGLTIPTRDEILAEIRERWKTDYGIGSRVDDVDGAMGRLAAILADVKDDILSGLAATVSALLPSTSVGALLAELVKFNGITKNVATRSTVQLTVTANAGGCTLPAGSIAGTVEGVQFSTDVLVAIAPNTSELVMATAVVEGAEVATAGTITEIVTPTYGWESVTNADDATVGNALETDPALRTRRWDAAVAVGLHHPSAIRKALADLDNVTAVLVEVNNNTTENENGVPPQHVRAIVRGGDSEEIAYTLFGPVAGSVAGGIGTWGEQSVVCTDAETGQTATIYFDRAVEVPIYVTIQTVKNRALYPQNGDALMKQAVVDFSEGNLEINDVTVSPFGLGDDVVASRLYTPANAVPGHSVRAVFISRSANPTSSADIVLLNDEIATFDPDNIQIQFVS